MALAALWVAGRILVLTPFDIAAAVVNAAFPVAVAIGIGIPIVRSRNRRNYFFVALLALLGCAVLAFHLAHRAALPWPERANLQVGLDVVLFIMAVMGGRVIPMFTNNGIPGTKATRHPLVEKGALGGVLALLAADLLQVPAAVVGAAGARRRRGPRRAALPSGSRGGRSGRRSSGSSTSPTAGSSSTWRCAGSRRWASWASRSPSTR